MGQIRIERKELNSNKGLNTREKYKAYRGKGSAADGSAEGQTS